MASARHQLSLLEVNEETKDNPYLYWQSLRKLILLGTHEESYDNLLDQELCDAIKKRHEEEVKRVAEMREKLNKAKQDADGRE